MGLRKTLSIEEIRADTAAQPREFMSTEKVEEYAGLMKSGVEFPGPIVFFDGKVHWLADGFHRVHAARSAGVENFHCVVKEGGLRDAVLYSCGANATHGIQRTNEDKRRAVMKLLQDAEWNRWSSRDIAKQCQVAHTFVNKLRERLTPSDTGNVSSMDSPSSRSAERTFTHPKTRKPTQMRTDNIGKRSSAKSEKDVLARSETTPTPAELATVSRAGGITESTSAMDGLKHGCLASGVRTFAEFCRANSATSVAGSIPPNELEEIRVSAASIYEWLDQLSVAIDQPKAIDTEIRAAEHAQTVHDEPTSEPKAAASDPWRDLGIPDFLRCENTGPDATNARNEDPALS